MSRTKLRNGLSTATATPCATGLSKMPLGFVADNTINSFSLERSSAYKAIRLSTKTAWCALLSKGLLYGALSFVSCAAIAQDKDLQILEKRINDRKAEAGQTERIKGLRMFENANYVSRAVVEKERGTCKWKDKTVRSLKFKKLDGQQLVGSLVIFVSIEVTSNEDDSEKCIDKTGQNKLEINLQPDNTFRTVWLDVGCKPGPCDTSKLGEIQKGSFESAEDGGRLVLHYGDGVNRVYTKE